MRQQVLRDQLVGTGRKRTDVVIDNEFAKLNAIRADRAGGVYFRNFTVQQESSPSPPTTA